MKVSVIDNHQVELLPPITSASNRMKFTNDLSSVHKVKLEVMRQFIDVLQINFTHFRERSFKFITIPFREYTKIRLGVINCERSSKASTAIRKRIIDRRTIKGRKKN